MPNIPEIENGYMSTEEPLITHEKEAVGHIQSNNGSVWMVYVSTLVAVAGSFVFGTCVGFSSPTQIGIMSELNLSYAEFSIFGSILTIGAMIGAITSGRIADFIGRKNSMRISSIVCITGWLIMCASMGPLSLDFGRFLTGYGIGLVSYVVPVYIGEITPKNLRGALATASQLFIVNGLSAAYIVGAFVAWRTLAMLAMIPCVVMFMGLFFIPESPRWLALVGKHKEFDGALKKLRGPGTDISREKHEIQESISLLQLLPKATLSDLFHRKNIRSVISGVGIMVFQQFVGINGIVFYAGDIFVSAGAPAQIASIMYALLQVVLTLVGAFLMDRAGRKPLLVASASGLFVGNMLIAASFFSKEHHMASDWVPFLAVAGVLVYIGSFSIGMGPVPWVILSEVFAINVKGIAGSLMTLVNWGGSWVVSFSFNFMKNWSAPGTFFIYAIFCIGTIIFTIKVVPETKGRTLEEIQAEAEAEAS